MPLGIGFVGDSEYLLKAATEKAESQMPLGIGFVGDGEEVDGVEPDARKVTNASRHWVRGGLKETVAKHGTDEQKSQMPLGIGFVGDSIALAEYLEEYEESQMPLGIGFVGDLPI